MIGFRGLLLWLGLLATTSSSQMTLFDERFRQFDYPEDVSARLPLAIMELDFRHIRNLMTKLCLEYEPTKNTVKAARCNVTKENQLWHHDKLGKRFHTKGLAETCLEDMESIGPCGNPLMSYDFNDNKLCRTVTQQCISDPTPLSAKGPATISNRWEFVKLTQPDVIDTAPDKLEPKKPTPGSTAPTTATINTTAATTNTTKTTTITATSGIDPIRRLRLRLSGWQSCLEYQPDGASIELRHCDPNSANQLWSYDPTAKRIRTGGSNSMCLKDIHSIASCSEPLTSYNGDEGKLCQSATGSCLEDPTAEHEGSTPRVAKWELTFVPQYEVPSEFLLIKNQASGRCVSADKDTIEMVACGLVRNQSQWTYEPQKGLIRNKHNPNKCISNNEDRVLELSDCSKERLGWSADEKTIWPRDRHHLCILKLYSKSSEYPVSCDSETSHTPPDLELALTFEPVPKAPIPADPLVVLKSGPISPGHYRMLKPEGTQKCLMTYFRRVHVGDCGPRSGGLWWLEPETGFLRNKAMPDKCLVGSLKRPLTLGDCQGAAKWTYDGKKLRHQSMDNTCLNGSTNIAPERLGTLEDTTVSDCDLANGFVFIEPPPKMSVAQVKPGQVQIRNDATNKCLGSFYGDMVSLVDCNSNVTRWQFDPSSGIIKASIHNGTTCLSSSRQDGLGFANLSKCDQNTTGWVFNGNTIRFSDWTDTCLTNSGSRNISRNPVVGNRCLAADDKGREAQVWRIETSPVLR